MIHRVICVAAKAVLPSWCTAPHTTILRDSGLPAAEVALRHVRARLALRLGTVHASNPMVARAAEPPRELTPSIASLPRPQAIHRYTLRERRSDLPLVAPIAKVTKKTRLQWLAGLLPAFPRPEATDPRWTEGSKADPTGDLSKKKAAKAFHRWYAGLDPWDTVIFSDGSELTDESGNHLVGYGYVAMQQDEVVAHGSGSLHTTSHVFDAEVVGALRGLEAAVALQDGSQLWSCIDSTSVIWGLRGTAPASSQWAFLEYQALADRYNAKIKWSPGHEHIEGNELADRLANAGAKGLGDPPTGLASKPSLSGVRSIIKRTQRNITAQWYGTAKTKLKPRYLRWKLDYKLVETPELRLPRPLLARFLAMRHGHGDFKGYHEWRGHEPSNYVPDCACGGSKSTDHLVHCPITRSRRAAWPDADTHDDKYLLEVLSDPQRFKKFVEVTDFFAATTAAVM